MPRQQVQQLRVTRQWIKVRIGCRERRAKGYVADELIRQRLLFHQLITRRQIRRCNVLRVGFGVIRFQTLLHRRRKIGGDDALTRQQVYRISARALFCQGTAFVTGNRA